MRPEIATSLGGKSLALHCDVADEVSVRDARGRPAEFGTLDVLHSNAGVFFGHGNGNDGPLDTLDLATWRRTLDVNLTGGFLSK
jgi:3-oxoacyl-[acyl-carrier protein] reductase